MLKQTVQYKREQIKQEEERKKQEEINKISQKIPYFKEKIEKQKKLLSLMLAIKKVSEKEEKTPEEINSLNEMIAMYEEQKNALARESMPVISDNTPEQIVGENSLLQQIQGFQLKPVKKNEVQMKPAQKPKHDHDVDGFVMTQDVLEKIKLNSVKPKNSVASIPEDKPTELELKLSKQRAKAGENTENTITLSNDVSECLSNLFNAQEIIPFGIELKLRKLEVLRPHLNSQEFSDREFAIIEDGFLQENIAEQVERVNALPVIREDDENRVSMTLNKELTQHKVPLSMYFNSSRREDKPIIIEEIPKLKV